MLVAMENAGHPLPMAHNVLEAGVNRVSFDALLSESTRAAWNGG
jgi:hypothetical protein